VRPGRYRSRYWLHDAGRKLGHYQNSWSHDQATWDRGLAGSSIEWSRVDLIVRKAPRSPFSSAVIRRMISTDASDSQYFHCESHGTLIARRWPQAAPRSLRRPLKAPALMTSGDSWASALLRSPKRQHESESSSQVESPALATLNTDSDDNGRAASTTSWSALRS